MKGVLDEEDVSVEEWQKWYTDNKVFKLQTVNIYPEE
jgi:hypothetical protein